MIEPEIPELGQEHELRNEPVPAVVLSIADQRPVEIIWRNELGGLTFRVADLLVKWNPLTTGIELRRERDRMQWLAPRHPAPEVLDCGSDDEAQWLVTKAMPGEHAVADTWRARRREAIRAIATGLRAVHALAIHDVPANWSSWVERTPKGLPEGTRGPRGSLRR